MPGRPTLRRRQEDDPVAGAAGGRVAGAAGGRVAGAAGGRVAGAAPLGILVGAAALAKADAGLIGALAPVLRARLDLTTTELGVLAAAAAVTGAIASLPAGHLVDTRSRRTIVVAGLALWSAAAGLAGFAAGVLLLGVARLASGVLSSVARPVAVSVIGDTYEPTRRAGALARLDAGQAVGAIACFLVAAGAGYVGSWRLAFFFLALVGLAGSVVAGRRFPGEPARSASGAPVPPLRDLVRIPTNAVVLASDSLGNFFYAGVSTFAVLFASERYHLRPDLADALAPIVAVAVIGGVLGGGRIGDRLARGRGGVVRLEIAAAADVVAAVALIPALAGSSLALAGISVVVGATALGISGPCLDAVRVDIVPSALRGRAEAARGVLTLGSAAAGPVTFGALATSLGPGATGTGRTFLIMLLPLAGAGLLLLFARRSYEADRARADAPT